MSIHGCTCVVFTWQVDVREFRSALPNMLHLHGIGVKPVTLEESLSTAAVDCG